MNFEPQKFFIGLVDFFSILLPGALLSYAVKDNIGSQVLDHSFKTMGDPEAWIIFFSSYLLGHYIFLVGSWLDEFYDVARRNTQTQRLKELARWRKLRPKWQRFLLWLVFKREKDQAVDRVSALKRSYLTCVGDPLDVPFVVPRRVVVLAGKSRGTYAFVRPNDGSLKVRFGGAASPQVPVAGSPSTGQSLRSRHTDRDGLQLLLVPRGRSPTSARRSAFQGQPG